MINKTNFENQLYDSSPVLVVACTSFRFIMLLFPSHPDKAVSSLKRTMHIRISYLQFHISFPD